MSNSAKPKVSVVMTVYNGERYLNEAIDSILAQTWTDFELIIINDGSTDATANIIAAYTDKRIRVLHNETNREQVYSRNRALEAAQGEYMAVNDADDISLPQRLEKQVALLDTEPNVGIVGSWVQTIDTHGKPLKQMKLPLEPEHIDWAMCFYVPTFHSAMMGRTQLIRKLGGYGTEETLAEDYELYTKMVRVAAIKNIPKVLQHTRVHPQRVTLAAKETCRQNSYRISQQYIEALLNRPVSADIVEFYRRWGYTNTPFTTVKEALRLYHTLYQNCLQSTSLPKHTQRMIQSDYLSRLLFMLGLRLIHIPCPQLLDKLNQRPRFQIAKNALILNLGRFLSWGTSSPKSRGTL